MTGHALPVSMFQLLSAPACVISANTSLKGLMASGIFRVAETSACSCTAQLLQGMQHWHRSEKKLLQRRISWSSPHLVLHKYKHQLAKWKKNVFSSKWYYSPFSQMLAKAWQKLLCSSHCSVLMNWGSVLNDSTQWITVTVTVLPQTIRKDQ